jgi:hypothetical protein
MAIELASNVDIAALLRMISDRKSGGRIGLASGYLSSIIPCLEGEGLCPANVFEMKSPDAWQKAIDEAASKFVYCDEEMLVKSHLAEVGKLTKGSILDFDAVLTSSSEDRDGDILETKGASIDPRAALLFNHVPMMPCGALVKVLNQTDQMALCKFAVGDVPVGRDMAALIELGGLRMSHGFKPKEFSPRAAKSGTGQGQNGAAGQSNGWHIKSFDIFEASLVPVPANVDAIITAFSRQKLHTPFVKSWAKSYHDGRPPQGRGFDAADLASGGEKNGTAGACGCGKAECGCGTKGAGTKDTSQSSAGGSVSNASVMGHVSNAGNAGATQATQSPMKLTVTCPSCGAIFDLTGVPDSADLKKIACPMCQYSAAGSHPSLGNSSNSLPGGPSDSAINAIRSPAPAGTLTKEGKVLSGDNHTKLKACDGHLTNVSSLLAEAHGHIKSVMKSAAGKSNDLTDDMNDSIGKSLESLSVKGAANFDAPGTKYLGGAIEPFLKGSFEWLSDELEDAAIIFLKSKEISFSHDTRAEILGTYADYAIVCIRDWQASVYPCYRIDWQMGESGEPEFMGTPKKVEITATVVEKALAARGPLAAMRKAVAQAISMSSKSAGKAQDDLTAVRDYAAEAVSIVSSERAMTELDEMLAANASG